jgi:hypothetical protein
MKYYYLLFCICCALALIQAHDNAHFWRPPLFIYESRFEKKKLTTLDLYLFGGNTRCSRNKESKKAPLLDIWGPQKLQNLSQNLPFLDPNNFLDQILINLKNLPQYQNSATLSYGAMFDLFEMYIDFYQNIVKGFFIHMQLPIRVIKLDNIKYHDKYSKKQNTIPVEWQLFLNNYQQILNHFNVNHCSIHSADQGDFTLSVGWAQNYENTEYIDFIDTTVEFGALFPTGRKKNPFFLFDIPSGYDGHWAFYADWRASIGLYDWLTIGTFINGLFFFDRAKTKLVSTAGTTIIKLARAHVIEKRGTLWMPGLYIKADHFIDGFSLLFGYSYTKKETDRLFSCDNNFPNHLINKDKSLKGFKMHTLQSIISYDFASEVCPYAPHIGFFIIIPLSGKYIFNLYTGGALIGLDCDWNF